MHRRLASALLIALTCLFCWLAMMIVHECGHVLHAWMSGGGVVKVVLHPLSISRTDVEPNPHPHFVAWGGAIWGCGLPAVLVPIVRRLRLPFDYLYAFLAGFCLIANGVYLGAGAVFPAGDARDLLRLGTPWWLLLGFGIAATVAGLRLWNGLSPHFGIGKSSEAVDRRATRCMAIACALIIVLELTLSDPL